jgi:hypothetical protein
MDFETGHVIRYVKYTNLNSVGPGIAAGLGGNVCVIKDDGYSGYHNCGSNAVRPIGDPTIPIISVKRNKSGHRLFAVGSKFGDTDILDPETGRRAFTPDTCSRSKRPGMERFSGSGGGNKQRGDLTL